MEDCTGFTYWAVSNEDGSVTPLDGFSAIGTTTAYPASTPVTTTAAVTSGQTTEAQRIEEEYRGVRIRRLGYVESERDLPWSPIVDLRTGDTCTSRETGRDWVWIVDHWEEIRAEYHTLEAADFQYNDAEVGIDMTDISGEPAPVLVSDDYLYIPGDMERRIRVRLEDIVAGDPPIIGNWVDVAEAVFNGERVNLTERNIRSSREHAERESDTTTETTPETFDDILGVGA